MTMKKISIPKTKSEWTKVEFNRTGIHITANGAYRFTLKPQTIEGFKIPRMEIWAAPFQISAELDTAYPQIQLRNDKVNEILKTVYLEQLRTNKK